MTVIRWIQLGFITAVVSAGMVVAGADGSGAGSGAGTGSGSGGHGHFQAAFDACAKSKLADSCQFTSQRGRHVTGTCQTPRSGGKGLICRWGNGSGGGGGSGHGSGH